jgi:hypothetical protein
VLFQKKDNQKGGHVTIVIGPLNGKLKEKKSEKIS